MLEEKDGWYVINLRDAPWYGSAAFGAMCGIEDHRRPFPDVGVRLYRLDPGKPNCRYHRESSQEDMLVLSGRCRLLVNDEERSLGTGDFVHCPPGTSHVMIGDGDAPCTVLMIGHRPRDQQLWYPANERARRVGAEAPEPTADPRVAYADLAPREPVEAPDDPLW